MVPCSVLFLGSLAMPFVSTDTRKMPIEIARDFVATVFNDREIDISSFDGAWKGLSYSGRFQLVDGIAWYRITCGPRKSDSWKVARED